MKVIENLKNKVNKNTNLIKRGRWINLSFIFGVNEKEFIFKISDIHYEVNMEILGCNAKILWNDIYCNIIDMINSSQQLQGFIICKNF